MGRKSKRQSDMVTANVVADRVRRVWALCRSFAPKGCSVEHREQVVHMTLLNTLLNQENNMRKAGIPIPDNYVEDRIEATWRTGGKLPANYTPCTRCEFCQPCDGGFKCTALRQVIDGVPYTYMVAADDGCSRGLLKEEYR